MGTWATGKYALMISDRSGMAFPYREMVREWTGMWVHTSEFEPKQPQLNPPYHSADAVALQHPRPQHKTGILVALGPQYWPGQFLSEGYTTGTTGMQPGETPLSMNKKRVVQSYLGKVTVSIT